MGGEKSYTKGRGVLRWDKCNNIVQAGEREIGQRL